MRTVYPDYYRKFKCSADKCRHSCCKDWEIDIDKESLKKYRKTGGEIGRKLRKSISRKGTAHFVLEKDGKCPHLNEDGLCNIILSLGEDSLCQICADHPRFRNYLGEEIQIGLGMCCEAAAELIVNHKDIVSFIIADDKTSSGNDAFDEKIISIQRDLIAIAQNRETCMKKRLEDIEERAQIKSDICTHELIEFVKSLERIDNSWYDILTKASETENDACIAYEDITAEQILVYLLYRYIPKASDDGNIAGWVLFCTEMLRLISILSKYEDTAEVCRMFSSEIEYSDENPDKIINWLQMREMEHE